MEHCETNTLRNSFKSNNYIFDELFINNYVQAIQDSINDNTILNNGSLGTDVYNIYKYCNLLFDNQHTTYEYRLQLAVATAVLIHRRIFILNDYIKDFYFYRSCFEIIADNTNTILKQLIVVHGIGSTNTVYYIPANLKDVVSEYVYCNVKLNKYLGGNKLQFETGYIQKVWNK